uniref:Protein DJ-1 n=1 Tax=Lygus hesperus TaxID=30085 RepID=A0A0A9XGD9_LYGHE
MPGANHLGESHKLKTIMHHIREQNKLYGAICASPVLALGPLGMLNDVKKATCYPSLENKFPAHVQYVKDCVVKSGNCLTSRGPGTAMLFALAAVTLLRSRSVA